MPEISNGPFINQSLFEGAWNLPSLISSIFCILLDVLSFKTDFEIAKKKKKISGAALGADANVCPIDQKETVNLRSQPKAKTQ